MVNNNLGKIAPRTEDGWKTARQEGFGSSEAGALMKLNFTIKDGIKHYYETPLSIWEKKTGRAAEEQTNDAMSRGHELEDGVAQGFARKTHTDIIKASAGNIIYYDKQHPWRRVTPDRFCWIPDMPHDRNSMQSKFILECKTYRGVIRDGQYPQYWYVQVMYQLGVCGCPYGYIAWLDSNLDVDFERIDFCQEDYDAICKVVDHYWLNHVLTDVAPQPTSEEDYASVFPHHQEGKSITLTEEEIQQVMLYKKLSEDIKSLQSQLDDLKFSFISKIQDAEYATDASGSKLFSYKSKSEFDEQALLAADPETYRKFLVTQPPKFDKTAFKKAVGSKAYNEYTTPSNSRLLRIN